MRLVLTLLALGLVALCFVWFADRPTASRGRTPRGTEPVHAAPAPVEDARHPPAPVRRAATELEEPTAPTPPPDDFPRAFLAGRVLHSDGEPAAGVALEVRAQSQRGRPRPLAELSTKENGSFEARVLGTGPFRLEASATSGGGLRFAAVLEDVEAGAREVVLVLPRSGRVSGRVLDERGEPVRVFTLELEREGMPAPVRAAIESEDGSFESEELAEEVWQLVVSAEGYGASSPRWISVPETTPPIRLTRACRLSGVVRGTDGRPRAGAKVELSSARERVFADANGAFAISGGAGVVHLQATDPSSIAGVPLELQVSPGEERAGLVLRLGASGGVSGRVVTLANRPAAGRSVAFRPLPQDQHGASVPPCTTDELGRFRADLPPGLWEASVALDEREIEAMELAAPSEERPHELRASEEVRVNANETSEVWLALAPAPVRVSGALTKAGERCQGGKVVAIDHRGRALYQARVEGASYALGLARPGRHEFHVTLGTTTRILWVDVPALGAHELDLDVPVGWVEGFVRTPDGKRPADVKVWARAPPTPQGGGTGHALTGPEGAFVLELAPGTYEVGTGTEEEGQLPWFRTRSVTVVERERLTGLELVLPRDPASPALEIVLRGPRGELVEGGRVSVTLPWTRPPHVYSLAAPLGSATFAALPSSEVVVAAEAPGYFLAGLPRVQIEWPKPRRVELTLDRALEVVVRVRSSGATGPVHDVDAVATSGLVFDSAPFAADSRPGESCFRFPLLPLGEYRLRVLAGAQVLERPLRVGANGAEPASLEISVP
jgi:hypothetical protein